MTSRIEDPRPYGYHDRRHAGAVLARQLEHFKGRGDVVVLGLPRGGVPVAHEVARMVGVPLDVFLVRKLAKLRLKPPRCAKGRVAPHR